MKNKLEYRIENGSLIMDIYFNNLKIGSINCGGVESILGKCKLFDEEYVALLKENEYMKHIAKDFEQLQQENKQLKDNWNKLKEWLKEYKEGTYGLGSYETGLSDGLGDVIKKMQELEQGSDSNGNN